jgi:hypothetical protein
MNRSWSLEEDGEEGREKAFALYVREKALPSYDTVRHTHKLTQRYRQGEGDDGFVRSGNCSTALLLLFARPAIAMCGVVVFLFFLLPWVFEFL